MEKEIIFEHVTFQFPGTDHFIFENLSLSLSQGVTTLVGQNGTGKSTFLLLAAGLLLPNSGKVYLEGIDTVELREKYELQRYVSFIYQNMEFETEDTVKTLLPFVYENGYCEKTDDTFVDTLVQAFDLGSILQNKTQEISKGELQRTILAFSLLYGSRVIMMDEPIFAMEDHQKRRAMKFLTEYAAENQISLLYSVHELEISRHYSDYTLLFQKHASPLYGQTQDILTRENLETAYEIPYSFLKQRESLYRGALNASEEYNKHRMN